MQNQQAHEVYGTKPFGEEPRRKNFNSQLLSGVVMLLLGLVFLLNNFYVIDIGNVWRYWPLIVVAIGLNKTLQAENPKERESGLWWIFWGAWLLVSTLHLFGLTFRTSWPLIIIAGGIHILWESSFRASRNYFTKEHHDGN